MTLKCSGLHWKHVKETVKELELEVKLEYVTEVLQPYDKMLMDEELLFIDEQRMFLFFFCWPCHVACGILVP